MASAVPQRTGFPKIRVKQTAKPCVGSSPLEIMFRTQSHKEEVILRPQIALSSAHHHGTIGITDFLCDYSKVYVRLLRSVRAKKFA